MISFSFVYDNKGPHTLFSSGGWLGGVFELHTSNTNRTSNRERYGRNTQATQADSLKDFN